MKLWNNYKKEMKIASRGFYFYVEIGVAVIVLAVLLMVVPTESRHKTKEVCFLNMSAEKFDHIINMKDKKGYHEQVEDEVFKLKPVTLKYTDEKGNLITKKFNDKKKVTVKQYYYHDALTGKHTKTKYFTDNFDDMIRIAYDKKIIATEMWYENNMDYYHNILFGYETDKFRNIIKVAHGIVDPTMITAQMEKEEANTIVLSETNTLNNRENYLPIIILVLGGLMGVIVIVGYISVDKSEGILKALGTSPFSVGSYLISKDLVSMTTALLSCIIITVPVIGVKANYILLIITILTMTFLSCAVGTFISSFFKDVKSAYGVILMVGIFLMLPIISYMVPAFNPKWMQYIFSYHMLESIKESLLCGDALYVLIIALCMALTGIIVHIMSVKRYKKIFGM